MLKQYAFIMGTRGKRIALKKAHCASNKLFLAGAEGFEPSARGFGDRCSTN